MPGVISPIAWFRYGLNPTLIPAYAGTLARDIISRAMRKETTITFRERMLRTFERKKVDRILWQPRLEHWYSVNKAHGTLPERYRDMELLKVYDDLNASVRTYGMFNRTIKITQGEDVKVKTEDHETYFSTTWQTPVGSLTQVTRRVRTETEISAYTVEHMVKTIEG